MKKVLIVFCLVMLGSLALGQKKNFTYQQAFERGEPRVFAQMPRIQEWLDDQNYLEYIPARDKDKARLMKVSAVSGKSVLFLDYGKPVAEGFFLENAVAHTMDWNTFIFAQNNDLYCYDLHGQKLRQLTATPAAEQNPTLSPDGRWIAFTREHNLYALEIASGLEKQITTDGSDTILNGYASWVYYEEILGRSSRYAAFWWSPNSEKIAFMRFDDSAVPVFPIYRADGVHGELEQERYPKAGDANPAVQFAIADVRTNKISWVPLDQEKEFYITGPTWFPDGKRLLLQWMNRGQDHLLIYSVLADSASKKQIYEERQPSWIEFTDITMLQDQSGFILKSDKEGWNRFYFYDNNGNLQASFPKENWSVRSISLMDEKSKLVYFQGTGSHSTESHLFCFSLADGTLKDLTLAAGSHNAKVSARGSYFIDTFSSISQPSKMDLYDSQGKLVRNLASAKTGAADEYAWGKSELFTIPSGDGYDLPASWVLPPEFDAHKKYPIIFSIYGGPDAGTVRNSFPGLSDLYWAQQGIITISVDHRGSGHFGKKGLAEMHRNLGKWEMHDLIAAVKWLRQQSFIDSSRIGITGGSYGGYTTCMAMTYGAGYFTHGVAEFSVTDWRLYDSVYTERYMDLPSENPQGYEFGSAMTHAKNYKGGLLIIHGTMDDNVHMQNTIQLVSRLEDLNKDFEMMLYPNGRHGWGGPKRVHLSRETYEFWRKNFLAKPAAGSDLVGSPAK